jgi:hypothetical protein
VSHRERRTMMSTKFPLFFSLSPFFLADADFLVQRKPRDQLIPNRWIRSLLSLVHPLPSLMTLPRNLQRRSCIRPASQGLSFFLPISPFFYIFRQFHFLISPIFIFKIEIFKFHKSI